MVREKVKCGKQKSESTPLTLILNLTLTLTLRPTLNRTLTLTLTLTDQNDLVGLQTNSTSAIMMISHVHENELQSQDKNGSSRL